MSIGSIAAGRSGDGPLTSFEIGEPGVPGSALEDDAKQLADDPLPEAVALVVAESLSGGDFEVTYRPAEATIGMTGPAPKKAARE